MASNPMQRKVRNSFLLGILVMLVIASLIGAIAFILIIKPNMDKEKEEGQIVYASVCQLKTSVNSGDEITEGMIEIVTLPSTSVPIDALKELSKDSATIARVDLGKGAILSSGVVAKDESELSNSLRYVEYNMITIPTDIFAGEYVDIRLRLSNTQDLIVISKKEIVNLRDNTIGLHLTEEEIIILNSAIVETYAMNGGAELYIAKYVNAGTQTAAKYTYSPTEEVVALITANPNIVQEARESIADKYYNSGAVRNPINNTLNQYAEERANNIEEGIQKQIEDAKKAREDYLSELNAQN